MKREEPVFPAISIRQPWASYILAGVKDIENRSRATHFRGTILVHTSLTIDDFPPETPEEEEALNRFTTGTDPDEWILPVGSLVGMVDILDCVEKHTSDYFSGPFGWVLHNPVPFEEPIEYKGKVGIFYVPRSLLMGTPAEGAVPGASPASRRRK